MDQLKKNKQATILLGVLELLVATIFFLEGGSRELLWDKQVIFTGGGIIFLMGVGIILFGVLGFKNQFTK